MTILKHELKQNFKSLLIWTLSVAVICAGCIYLYKSVVNWLRPLNSMLIWGT